MRTLADRLRGGPARKVGGDLAIKGYCQMAVNNHPALAVFVSRKPIRKIKAASNAIPAKI